MAGASIFVRGLSAALKSVSAAQRHTLPSITDTVATLLVAGVKATFVRGEDPDTGKKWPEITHRMGRPLRDRGRLMRSIHAEKRSRRVSIGTNLIYAATHQFGDPNRRPKNAPFLVFQVMGRTVKARKVSIKQRRFLPTTDKGLDRATGGKLKPTLEKLLRSTWS